jgi:hypothetical protein
MTIKLPATHRLTERIEIADNRDYDGAFDLETERGHGTTQTALTLADLIELARVVNAKIAELLTARITP